MGIWKSTCLCGASTWLESQKVYGPFFFAEETVTGMTYLDMLQLWLMPQLQNIPTFIFQQDGSPAHFHWEVRQYLNTVLPGRASGNDQPLMPLPPTLRPVIFFFADMSRDLVFVPPLPHELADLKAARIIAAVKNVDAPMWTRVARTWLSYRCVPFYP